MKVQFTRVNPGGWRWHEERQAPYWGLPFASATVEGHIVKVTPRHGWSCDCDDNECGHVDAVAALIQPSLLTSLEGEETEPTHRKRNA